jgi:hypothetical protein
VELLACAATAAQDVGGASADDVSLVLTAIAQVRRLIDGREIECLARLEELAAADPSVNPEHVNATATRRSLTACTRAGRRARAAVGLPVLRGLVDQGLVSGEHLDAFARAMRSLEAPLRPVLAALEGSLAAAAIGSTVEEFTARLVDELRRIEGDDGLDRLTRQRRNTGVRQWTDKDGMWRLAGRFDPATGVTLAQLLQRQTEARFHQPRPELCPTDPVLMHEFLQAQALVDLITGTGVSAGGVEVIVTIDEQSWQSGRHAGSRIDCGAGVELPVAAIRSLAELSGRTRFVPVVLDSNGVVIRQGMPVPSFEQLRDSLLRPVELDAGRTRRHATRHQRRALRAMYRRCAIAGCSHHVSATHPHHLQFWNDGGCTDLHLLLPLCPHHHRRLHAEGWDVTLGHDRSLVVRRDGKVIMTTGPPADHWR